jgi:hypothetical protein
MMAMADLMAPSEFAAALCLIGAYVSPPALLPLAASHCSALWCVGKVLNTNKQKTYVHRPIFFKEKHMYIGLFFSKKNICTSA